MILAEFWGTAWLTDKLTNAGDTLMPFVGFEIPALLMCAVWLRYLGGETWRSTVVVSVATVAAFYLLFLYGLRIPLPHLLVF